MSVLRVQLGVVTDVRTLQEVTSASVLKGGLLLEMTNAHALVSMYMCLGVEGGMLLHYVKCAHMNIEGCDSVYLCTQFKLLYPSHIMSTV